MLFLIVKLNLDYEHIFLANFIYAFPIYIWMVYKITSYKGSRAFMVWDVCHGQGPGLGREKLSIKARLMVPGYLQIMSGRVMFIGV